MSLIAASPSRWTPDEDNTILAKFPEGGWSACRLMDRTPREVVLRARRLLRMAVADAAPTVRQITPTSKEAQLLAIMREDVRVLRGRAA
jgi:hypothetical protein